jgi:hypothetical protein
VHVPEAAAFGGGKSTGLKTGRYRKAKIGLDKVIADMVNYSM